MILIIIGSIKHIIDIVKACIFIYLFHCVSSLVIMSCIYTTICISLLCQMFIYFKQLKQRQIRISRQL